MSKLHFFFNLEESGIVRFEQFLNEKENTATLIEVFENVADFQGLGDKILGSPINLRFQELFQIESLTVLGAVSDEFKTKLQPMNPTFKTYLGGINQYLNGFNQGGIPIVKLFF